MSSSRYASSEYSPKIEAELYLKATNTGLLLHYQSHVDCAIDNSSAENHA